VVVSSRALAITVTIKSITNSRRRDS